MAHDIAREIEKIAEDLGVDRKRSIGEVAKDLKVETHVIRFWEENFPQIKPEIGSGKRRYYYNKQIKILKRIKKFLYEEGYTIAGLKKLLSKRKQDEYKEEDLDVILAEQTEMPSRVFSQNTEFEIDDFINPNIKIETGMPIDPQSRLRDFANIKVLAIDPKIRKEIEQNLSSIKKNLRSFKSILN